MLEETARSFAFKACQSVENIFGPSFFEQHLAVVADFSDRLAVQWEADRELVRVAAYLHDISAILDFRTLPVHPVAGAEIAGTFLSNHGYPAERTEKVRQCIRKHSTPVRIGEGTLEEVCLSQADALSQVARPGYWMFYAFQVRKMSFLAGCEWYRQRIDSHWSVLDERTKALDRESIVVARKCVERS